MIEFQGGPANGKALMLKRAPVLLRVVTGPRGGSLDALDRLADEPEDHERIHVYRRIGRAASMFMRPGGRFAVARYEYFAEHPRDAVTRSKEKWQAWASARYAELFSGAGGVERVMSSIQTEVPTHGLAENSDA